MCVPISMEIKEIIIMAIGTMVSVIAFYLKRESLKVERLSNELRKIEIDLAKNSARDCERWEQTQKLLEDRRQDIVKIFEKINNGKRF